MKLSAFIFWVAFVACLLSCRRERPNERIIFDIPGYFPSIPTEPERNPTTRFGLVLGEKLFFDPKLSASDKFSCATCHQAENAFSDKGTALSQIGTKPLLRNTPGLFNLVWMNSFFWDGGARNLESVSVAPLVEEHEMGQSLKELVRELSEEIEYRALFKKAFDSDSIYTAVILRALAQYQRSLISHQSKYDFFMQGKVLFSELELKGMELVSAKCGSCHPAPLFTDNLFHNNGLDSTIIESGHLNIYHGRERISHQQEDMLKYKTPSLRNLGFTLPYMHDGRFETIEAVLDHYRNSVFQSATLDSVLISGEGKTGISISVEEGDAIKSFLYTLNDTIFVSQRR